MSTRQPKCNNYECKCKTVFSLITENDLLEENELDVLVNMSNKKCPRLNILLNNIPVSAIIDTGSELEAVSEGWFQENKRRLGHFEMLPLVNTVIRTAVNKSSKPIKKQILLHVKIGEIGEDVNFMVIPNLSHNCIIGINFLRLFRSVINMDNNTISFQATNIGDGGSEQQEFDMLNINKEDGATSADILQATRAITDINEEQQQRLYKILNDNATIFRGEPGRIRGYEHRIAVVDDTPFFQKSWPIPLALREKVDEEVQQMLNNNIIERADGPFVNPLITVLKRDKSVRVCLDARRINAVMKPDYEGSAPVNEILSSCSGIKVMSSIDLRNSFWQVQLHCTSRDYTGFIYKGRMYRFTVMPFGLKTSSASLARALDQVLSENVKKFTLIYVDDCLVVSKDVEQHLLHLKLLFEDFRRANITINFRKSQLFRKEMSYLGFKITTDGITTEDDKISAIMNFPRPRNQKQLKSFLGLTNFYNRFTDKYAERTQPLLQLLKKDKRFRWTSEEEQQFQEIKKLFIESVVLTYPDNNKRYYLQTDASKFALGGQLYQFDDQQQIAVIAFTSRVFRGAELNYHTTEKELLAIMHCINKFRMYLIGKRFSIITDNKALTFLNRCHLSSSRIGRWTLALQEYDFDIIHCKGKDNVVSDVLSRNPEDIEATAEICDDLEINKICFKLNKQSIQVIRNIRVYQREDPKLLRIMERIQESPTEGYNKNYLIHQGILYRRDRKQWKVYVPESKSTDMIQDIHQTFGHSGAKRTMEIFKESLTTDKIVNITKNIVKKCIICQKYKDNNIKLHGATMAILPEAKGQLISIDYYGPLATSNAGVRYILVVTDNFTKYVQLYAVRRATTAITLKKIREYGEQHGLPKAILSDNGTQFTTSKWKEGLTCMGIKAKYTAIRNPCTNLAERINRQLGNYFRVILQDKHTNWSRQLKTIEALINESFHETIGMTPYQAHYGRVPIRSWTRYLDKDIFKLGEEDQSEKIYLRIKEKRQKEADKINQRVKLTEFDVGDKVLIKTNPISDAARNIVAKFCSLFAGPFVVHRKLGKATYELAGLTGKPRGTFNVRQMKKYYE